MHFTLNPLSAYIVYAVYFFLSFFFFSFPFSRTHNPHSAHADRNKQEVVMVRSHVSKSRSDGCTIKKNTHQGLRCDWRYECTSCLYQFRYLLTISPCLLRPLSKSFSNSAVLSILRRSKYSWGHPSFKKQTGFRSFHLQKINLLNERQPNAQRQLLIGLTTVRIAAEDTNRGTQGEGETKDLFYTESSYMLHI